MVPARSRMFHHHDSSKSGGGGGKSQYCIAAQIEASAGVGGGAAVACRRARYPPPRLGAMAAGDDDDDEDAAGTSTRRGGDDDKDWLQLGLASSSSSSGGGENDIAAAPAPAPSSELDMFANAGKQYNGRIPPSSSSAAAAAAAMMMMKPPSTSLPLPIYRSYHHQYGHGGRCRPTAAAFLPFARPSRIPGADDVGLRVISPPLRAEAAALWLTLQAAPDQAREPILPQIPKSYLRIKDSNMKVEVVMKYLAGKLGLTQSHLQVELTCRGQLLPPFLLVKTVRDSIWCSSPGPTWEDDNDDDDEMDLVELHRRSPATAATDHVMALFYRTSRSCH
uniref:Uncharacterized protein n=1 Tax=Leersia perrieri TaxID=77586 RepID=A0A0D9V9U4_9ORYZ